jgi:uncharacterized protein (TIGR03437 family)
MQTIQNLFMALVVTAATLAAQNPLINLVVNATANPAGSGISPAQFPNSGIAQGSIFLVWGIGLGPSALRTASQPLPPSLAGTSITITVNGTTVTAPMYWTVTAQVAAVMPSTTPVGDGTLTLTYNGKSGSGPVTVVPATFGISNADIYDDDDGFVIRSIAAVTFPDYQYVSDTHPAKPGDSLTLWGTGLGATPNNGGDSGPAPAANIGSAPLVFVGGVQSPSVTYWGRSPNTVPGLDQINFVVPADAPLGCNVSIIAQTATPATVSNGPTIALADTDGATCFDLTQSLPSSFYNKSGLKTMLLSLQQNTTLRLNADGSTTTTTASQASVQLLQFTQALQATAQNLNLGLTLGSCSTGVWDVIPDLPASTPLSAGTSVTLTPPSGSALALGAQGPGDYSSDSLPTALPGGTWSFSNGAGGSDIGPVHFAFPVPQPVRWTNAAAMSSSPIDRSNPLTIIWTGGDSNGYVRISGEGFACAAPTSPGQFTIPTSILLGLPAGGGTSIEVATIAFSSVLGTIPGFDAAAEISTFATTALPIYFK